MLGPSGEEVTFFLKSVSWEEVFSEKQVEKVLLLFRVGVGYLSRVAIPCVSPSALSVLSVGAAFAPV